LDIPDEELEGVYVETVALLGLGEEEDLYEDEEEVVVVVVVVVEDDRLVP